MVCGVMSTSLETSKWVVWLKLHMLRLACVTCQPLPCATVGFKLIELFNDDVPFILEQCRHGYGTDEQLSVEQLLLSCWLVLLLQSNLGKDALSCSWAESIHHYTYTFLHGYSPFWVPARFSPPSAVPVPVPSPPPKFVPRPNPVLVFNPPALRLVPRPPVVPNPPPIPVPNPLLSPVPKPPPSLVLKLSCCYSAGDTHALLLLSKSFTNLLLQSCTQSSS